MVSTSPPSLAATEIGKSDDRHLRGAAIMSVGVSVLIMQGRIVCQTNVLPNKMFADKFQQVHENENKPVLFVCIIKVTFFKQQAIT